MKKVQNRGLLLAILAVVCLTAMALLKGMDTSLSIAGVVGTYMARRGAEGVSSVLAAGKDPNADTLTAIREVKGA